MATRKKIVPTPREAKDILQRYLSDPGIGNNYYTAPRGTRKWATVRQMVEHFNRKKTPIDRGWLGRSLMNSTGVQTMYVRDSRGRQVVAYRTK